MPWPARVPIAVVAFAALSWSVLPGVGMSSSAAAATTQNTFTQSTFTQHTSTVASGAASGIQHVVWVWMENRSYNDVIGSAAAPYINSLARQYGSASNAWSISHPSAPNYIGAASGLPLAQLPANDCTTCVKPGPDIFSQVSSWRAYQESMTTPCRRTQDSGGRYVPRHNSALYFTDISAASCNANDVNYTQLATDLTNHTLPAFSFVTPNLDHDMHNGSISAGDSWLQSNLPQLLNSPEYTSGSTVIFLTFDEGSGGSTLKGTDCTNTTSQTCRIPMIVISPSSVGTSSARKLTLYSALKGTEDLLGVPELGLAATAPDLLTDFGLAGVPTPSASFTTQCTGLTCSFDGSASSSAGSSIESYTWDFGDGSPTATGSGVSHSYPAAGPYTAMLTVVDTLGQPGSTSQSLSVQEPSPAMLTVSCTLLHCTADASGSALPDIASYTWDFGDGSATTVSQTSTTAHAFTSAGSYTVTVTVADGGVGSASTSQTVSVTRAVAAFTDACTGLSCSFDGSSSTAPGASLTAFAWDFGDGTTGAGVTPTHMFAVPGTYPVVLSVTDSTGDVTSVTQSVVVTAVAPAISFVGANSTSANATTETVTVPAAVAAGDGLLLVATSAVATAQTAPSGWQLVKTVSNASLYSSVWQRVATAGDHGTAVKVTFGTQVTKGTLQVVAYTGTGPSGPVASAVARTGVSSVSTFATPSAGVTVAGSWVMSCWSARSTNVTSWSAPGGQTVRSTADGTGGGHIDSLFTDAAAPAPLGNVGGLSASTDQPSGAQVAWTFVVVPKP